MPNYLHVDEEEAYERERAFHLTGHMLGLLMCDRDLSEFDTLRRSARQGHMWIPLVAAMGPLLVAISYLVDIATDLDHDWDDLDGLDEHLDYVRHEHTYCPAGDEPEDLDAAGDNMLNDPLWVQAACEYVLKSWSSINALVEILTTRDVADEEIRLALDHTHGSDWNQLPRPTQGPEAW